MPRDVPWRLAAVLSLDPRRTLHRLRLPGGRCLPLVLAAWVALGGRMYGADFDAASAFRFDADTFSFANQTVYIYPNGYAEKRRLRPGEKPPSFTLHCFAMCRSVEQFRKFARFEPRLARPDDEALAALVRKIFRRPVWRAALPPEQRVVVPGYANLRELSVTKPLILQKNVGGGIWTYFRPGNYRMCAFWLNNPRQPRTRRTVDATLARNDLFVAYLTTFPDLAVDHAVILYGRAPTTAADQAAGIVRYRVYDPNHPEGPRLMTYDTHAGAFSYQKDWDFVGGKLTVLQVYGRPIQ